MAFNRHAYEAVSVDVSLYNGCQLWVLVLFGRLLLVVRLCMCENKTKYDSVMCGDCQFGFIGLSVVIGGSIDRNKHGFVVVYVVFVHRLYVSSGECHACAKHIFYDQHCVMILIH